MNARLCLLVAWWTALALSCPMRAEDLDEDGLDDALEQMLIDRHAPILIFDSREDDWPSSVTWYIQHCDLRYRVSDGHETVLTKAQLAADPRLILSQNHRGVSSNMVWNSDESPYRLDLDNDYESGQGPAPVGMYAHVVPQGAEILIQYWQFLPFNDSQACCDNGDHEGDWLWLDVYVLATPAYPLTRMVYHHHGDTNCSPTVLPSEGHPLPGDGIPRCYLEEGSHEWWPFASNGGECDYAWGIIWENEGHNGLGPSYRAESPPNLGELFAPLLGGENELVLQFNGKWGKWGGSFADSPFGPIHQSFPAPPFVVAYVDAAASAWSGQGLGSRYHPYQAVNAGASAVQAGGRVRIAPGSYPGAITISKTMTLEAWGGGTVTIGQ